MILREVKFVLDSNESLSTRVLVDESSTVYEAMSQSGLLPRDGSLRYAMDKEGNSLNHQTIGKAPDTIHLGMLKHVESIWGETNSNGPFTGTECLDGAKLLIPGIEVGEYTNVFSTQHKQNENTYAYRFRTLGEPYQHGDIVFVQAPRKGNTVSLFNPQTGQEDIKMNYECSDLQRIRGFWGCCEIRYSGRNKTVVLRSDLSPIPKKFKPFHLQLNKGKKNYNMNKKPVQCKMNTPSVIQDNQSVFKGSVLQPSGGWQRALISGNLPKKGTSCEGVLVRFARKNSPALVNRPYYRDGHYVFVKVPEGEDRIQLYNIHHPDSPIELPYAFQQVSLVDAKGQWVVAKITRNASNKRMLLIEGTPKNHPSCHF
tara:strand:+ start:240 stop:1349 length:1110 start_codon:yes stop_codon:yes gene_type:complete